jgi:hypothetical protein
MVIEWIQRDFIEKRVILLTKVTVSSLTYDKSDLICFKLHNFIFITELEMSTVISNDFNLKLWNAARDGDNDAVVAAIVDGANVNWNNDSYVSDNDMQFLMIIMIVV